MSYVFDTSSLIGAWVRLYPPDSFPGLWQEIDQLVTAGRLFAPEEVLIELKAQDDDLYAWAKARSNDMIVATTRPVMVEVRSILAQHQNLTKTGTGRGMADPFVIALGSLKGLPVVTQEQGGSAGKPRIPYVCLARGVGCISFLDVIRAEGWRF